MDKHLLHSCFRYLNQRFIEDIEELSKHSQNITNINIGDKFTSLEQTIMRLEEKCQNLEKSHSNLAFNCTELESSLKSMEDKNASLQKSYFNLEGDYSNLQQKFYKLEENSTQMKEMLVTLETSEKSLKQEVDILKAFKEHQVASNLAVEEKIQDTTLATQNIQLRVDKTEKDTSSLITEVNTSSERIVRLESSTHQNIESIKTHSEAIDKFAALYGSIQGEVSQVTTESQSTSDKLNSFMAKYATDVSSMKESVSVNQTNINTLDNKFTEFIDNINHLEARVKSDDDNRRKNDEMLVNKHNELGNKIMDLHKMIDANQENFKANFSILRDENMHKLHLVEDQMKYVNEKVFHLEEAHQQQLQKNTYFENFDAKLNRIDEMRQQSEARAKDEVDATITQSNRIVEQLTKDFTDKLDNMEVIVRQEQAALNKISDKFNTDLFNFI